MGILTSGLIDAQKALSVLMIGPVYEQIVIKTEKAASALLFVSSRVLSHEEIAGYRAMVNSEENAFQEAFVKIIADLPEAGVQ